MDVSHQVHPFWISKAIAHPVISHVLVAGTQNHGSKSRRGKLTAIVAQLGWAPFLVSKVSKVMVMASRLR
jgi:hypothetical protein